MSGFIKTSSTQRALKKILAKWRGTFPITGVHQDEKFYHFVYWKNGSLFERETTFPSAKRLVHSERHGGRRVPGCGSGL